MLRFSVEEDDWQNAINTNFELFIFLRKKCCMYASVRLKKSKWSWTSSKLYFLRKCNIKNVFKIIRKFLSFWFKWFLLKLIIEAFSKLYKINSKNVFLSSDYFVWKFIWNKKFKYTSIKTDMISEILAIFRIPPLPVRTVYKTS